MVMGSSVKLSAAAAIVVAVFVSGCGGQVRPSAETLAVRVVERPNSVTSQALERSGFSEVGNFGGPRLRNGKCYEKARAHPIYGSLAGVDVVRVCFAKNATETFVFGMHTHGERWTEYFPNPMSGARDMRSMISESTMKRLMQ